MQAEAAFTRGQLDDAMIALERTYAQTDGSGQENIALCGDFLSLRLSLFGQGAPRLHRWGAMSCCSNSTMPRGYASFGMPAVPTIMRCSGRKKRYRSRSACIGWRA